MSKTIKTILLILFGGWLSIQGCTAQFSDEIWFGNAENWPLLMLFNSVLFVGGLVLAINAPTIAAGQELLPNCEYERVIQSRYRTKNSVNWDNEADIVNRLYMFNQRYPKITVKSERGRATGEQLGLFKFVRSNASHGSWQIIVPLDLDESFMRANANEYISIDYGSDSFLSRVDSDVGVRIEGFDEFYAAKLVGFTSINLAYKLDEIRNAINPILRKKGYHCAISNNGSIVNM